MSQIDDELDEANNCAPDFPSGEEDSGSPRASPVLRRSDATVGFKQPRRPPGMGYAGGPSLFAEEDFDEQGDSIRPDLALYLEGYTLTNQDKIALLRTYANYLSSKSRVGLHRGPYKPRLIAKRGKHE